MTRLNWTKCCVAWLLPGAFAYAQVTAPQLSAGQAGIKSKAPVSSNFLRTLNGSLETVVSRVSPAVVQIVVTGYGPVEDHGHETGRIARRHSIGSGVVVDPDGYIITNAHVVEGAQRVRVILPAPAEDSLTEVQPIHAGQILEAKVLGTHKQSDLALLKVEATRLPVLPFRNDVRVRQGELVFAIGSPEGLRDSVTMGIVSSVARQTDPNDPMVYIQTDTALNPGNSGGPLVDIDGNLVGINTLILSQGGGSEGLGFAIPAAIVHFDYQNLRNYGRVQRVSIGARAQNITPPLAAGLGLARSWGAIISDTVPQGPAEAAGLHTEDIVLAIDDRPIASLPDFMAALYLHPHDQILKIDVLRRTKRMSFNVPVNVYHEKIDELAEVPDLQQTLIRRLSIFVTDLDDGVRSLLPDTRGDSGVVVVAQTSGANAVDTGLQTGDIIHAIDHTRLQSVSQFQAMVHDLKSGDAVVLQIERNRKLQYLSFEME
jgi:serine protease Do